MKNAGVRKQAGFSMLELTFVVAVAVIIMAVAVLRGMPALQNSRVDAGLQITLGRVRRVQQRAIDERHAYRVSFVAPRTVRTDRVDLDTSGNRTFVFVETIDLPSDMQFAALSGIPTGSANTPDGLGSGSTAIDFGVESGGGQTDLFLQADGRVLDSSNRLSSGVVYVARPGDLLSSRAVSVVGATGRAKGWRLLGGASGTVVWRQR